MRAADDETPTLPEDAAALRALLLKTQALVDTLSTELGGITAERDALASQNERLQHLLLKLKRRQFGTKSERLPEDQLLFAFEEIEATLAGNAAEVGKASPTLRDNQAKRRRAGRGRLPAHLPRIEQVLAPEATACPCCRGPLVEIGTDAAERLDVIPARFRVVVTKRPKLACRACPGVVLQAPAPARLVEGGMPTETTVAHVLVSGYADHLPLYRQSQILARQGIGIGREVLASWVGTGARSPRRSPSWSGRALPGLAAKGDVADWIEGGGDRDRLLALADGSPEFGGAPDGEANGAAATMRQPPGDGHEPVLLSIGSDAEIARRLTEDLQRQHGPIVFSEGAFWRYAGTRWEALPDELLWLAAFRYDGAEVFTWGSSGGASVKLSKARVESILALMRPALTRKEFFAEPAVGINCMSGFIRFSEDRATLVPHSPDHRQRHVLAGRWPAVATNEEKSRSLLTKLLEGCFRDDEDKAAKIDLLGEVAGVAALGAATRLIEPKALVLKGESAENSKSEVLNALRALLPKEAVASISPARFGDRTFSCHLAGKLLNAPDELAGPDAIASDAFKQIITGEPLTVRDVYKSAVEFRPTAQHVFATNALPGFQGGMDRGVRRRLMVLAFNRVIPRPERIEHIGLRIGREEPDLLLDWAVRGAERVLAARSFTVPKSSAEALRDWICSADPVLAWLESDEVGFTQNAFVPKTRTRDAHAQFKRWALEEGYDARQVPSINGFSQRVVGAGKGISKRRDSRGPLFVGLECKPRAADVSHDGRYG